MESWGMRARPRREDFFGPGAAAGPSQTRRSSEKKSLIAGRFFLMHACRIVDTKGNEKRPPFAPVQPKRMRVESAFISRIMRGESVESRYRRLHAGIVFEIQRVRRMGWY